MATKVPALRYEKDTIEHHIASMGTDPEQCTLKKVSKDDEPDDYEVTTDFYHLGRELVFHVYRNCSTSMFGASTTWYWDNNFKEALFYTLYPQESWPKVLQAHCGYRPDFEVDPMNFREDVQSVMDTTDEIVKVYTEHGFSPEDIIWFTVRGRYTDTKRTDGVTMEEYYTENVPKDLIYQSLFEYEFLANINDDNVDKLNSDFYRTRMEKYYLFWAIENGLVDIYSDYSFEDRQSVNDFENNSYYYAVINGEATDETEEIFANYKGAISYSAFYKILKRQGYPVEGDWYHFKFKGIDGKEYEFGYDLCILQADPNSSEDASDIDFARTFNNFYYICDGEKYIYPDLKLEDRQPNRLNIHWSPFVGGETLTDMTGLVVTSTYEK